MPCEHYIECTGCARCSRCGSSPDGNSTHHNAMKQGNAAERLGAGMLHLVVNPGSHDIAPKRHVEQRGPRRSEKGKCVRGVGVLVSPSVVPVEPIV